MESAIKNFYKKFKTDNLLIIGDMLELGLYSKSAHSNIVELIKTLSFDRVITVGKTFFKINKTPNFFMKFNSTNELIKYIKSNKIKESNILIKGSRSLTLEKIIKHL
tara:strand:- start:515 stop:835 length:321 start_codon:yes stop_codon:yes gene_type:complete